MNLNEQYISDLDDKNIGMTSVNEPNELARVISIPRKDTPLMSSRGLQSRSKILKRFAIHLIRFCLKSGILENKTILKFLEENDVFLKGRTFDRYKSMAERELENDLDASIWLSEKTQNALIHDYKDICDRYDRQLALDDILMDGLIKQAVDSALQRDTDPRKYYKYLDVNEMMKIQAISNFTMKNKLELISKGFVVYKIKQHIEQLYEQQRRKNKSPNNGEVKSNFDSLRRQQQLTNPTSPSGYDSSNNIQMTGNIRDDRFEVAEHIKDIEKRLGKRVSTLERRIDDP